MKSEIFKKIKAASGVQAFPASAVPLGAAAGFAGAHIMFGNLWVSLAAAVAGAFAAIPAAAASARKKQEKKRIAQFRDMLEAFSNSVSAGRNLTGAFADAQAEIIFAYGADSFIALELGRFNSELKSNVSPSVLLRQMSDRCGIEEMRIFTDTLSVCIGKGGDLKRAATECREVISGRIETEAEIEAAVCANKNELKILMFMPFAVTLAMRLLGNETLTGNSLLNVSVKLAALAVFGAAYYIGLKITDIKV